MKMSESARVSYDLSGAQARRIHKRAPGQSNERTKKILDYIRQHQGEHIKLSALADYAGYNGVAPGPAVSSKLKTLIKRGKIVRFDAGRGGYSYQLGDGRAPSVPKSRFVEPHGTPNQVEPRGNYQLRYSRLRNLAQAFVYDNIDKDVALLQIVKEFVSFVESENGQ